MLEFDKILGPQQRITHKPPKRVTLDEFKEILRNGEQKPKDTGSPTGKQKNKLRNATESSIIRVNKIKEANQWQ